MKNHKELGRSMVEMLGVLAIVGVLSILGIAGYQKAMIKVKANQAMESVMKFKTIVEEYLLLHPEAANAAIRSNSGTPPNDNSIVYLNRTDILPDFVKGIHSKFVMEAKLNLNSPQLVISNIQENGLCSSMLSRGNFRKTSDQV